VYHLTVNSVLFDLKKKFSFRHSTDWSGAHARARTHTKLSYWILL
jgi:hypothetical protein